MSHPDKPIKPETHGIIDYGLGAIQILGPTVFGIRGPARTLSRLFGLTQSTINVLTDHPVATKRLTPFRLHGALEKWNAPVFLGLPMLTGALKKPRARNFFLGFFALAVVVYNLTGWEADPGES